MPYRRFQIVAGSRQVRVLRTSWPWTSWGKKVVTQGSSSGLAARDRDDPAGRCQLTRRERRCAATGSLAVLTAAPGRNGQIAAQSCAANSHAQPVGQAQPAGQCESPGLHQVARGPPAAISSSRGWGHHSTEGRPGFRGPESDPYVAAGRRTTPAPFAASGHSRPDRRTGH